MKESEIKELRVKKITALCWVAFDKLNRCMFETQRTTIMKNFRKQLRRIL